DPRPPWPGRLPSPSPSLVLARPAPAAVLDESGVDVGVTARFELTGEPSRVVLHGGARAVRAWAGPWPADERWWEPESGHRRARLQVLLADRSDADGELAVLLVRENERWLVEGVYD
ncbi:MAG: DNA polymerase Y family protein, partial [Labedaea sp.]